ncbi:MAG: acyl-CoA/acyl-ACP dehydrogenase [Pirellulaceae bacterium]|nr:acyl-CoA/acyl-ACP dehydrogenase [Pirellulaceae bacterium]
MLDDTRFSVEQLAKSPGIADRLLPVCQALSERADEVDRGGGWPSESLECCAAAGVYRWFLPPQYDGWGWNQAQILAGLLGLSQSCLTTTFIVTQWHAACRRIQSSTNSALRDRVLPQMANGQLFATVGISHLTTSRQHVSTPVLRATTAGEGYQLDGFSPWVTGASAAHLLVLGATLPDGQQILAAVPRQATGVTCHPGQSLLALSATCTDRVEVAGVTIRNEDIVAGPAQQVMQVNTGGEGGAGGLHTSILAIGLSMRAVEFLQHEARQRPALRAVADKLASDVSRLHRVLQAMSAGQAVMTATGLRQQANSLVLRTTQAALQAAKGAGFVQGHPAGRWAREALFFLVWSCPQTVVDANLCELAGLDSLG